MKLQNVRLSFHSIFEKSVYDGNEGKYEATFLIPKKNKELYKKIKTKIDTIILNSGLKISTDRICLKDGDEKEYDGYKDHFYLKASSLKRPLVLNRDRTPLTADDEVIYSGCIVNAVIDFWLQNNKYGKRINSNLYGLQFVKDDEPFGMCSGDAFNQFESLDENEQEIREEDEEGDEEITF